MLERNLKGDHTGTLEVEQKKDQNKYKKLNHTELYAQQSAVWQDALVLCDAMRLSCVIHLGYSFLYSLALCTVLEIANYIIKLL